MLGSKAISLGHLSQTKTHVQVFLLPFTRYIFLAWHVSFGFLLCVRFVVQCACLTFDLWWLQGCSGPWRASRAASPWWAGTQPENTWREAESTSSSASSTGRRRNGECVTVSEQLSRQLFPQILTRSYEKCQSRIKMVVQVLWSTSWSKQTTVHWLFCSANVACATLSDLPNIIKVPFGF